MASRTNPSHQLAGRSVVTLLLLIASSVVVVLPLDAGADGHCYYDRENRWFVCDDGGGGGSGGEHDPTNYWTAWTLVGPCGGGGGAPGGGGLVDLGTGLLSAVRYHYIDGEIVDTQAVCIDITDSEDTIWNAVREAAQALPEYGWEADPDPTISKGLTGLETWLWTSHGTQVGPITTGWADPVTGIVFAVEGRGWTEEILWDTGDGIYGVFGPTFDDAIGIGGSHDSPPAAHTYETSSADAGHSAGYPVAVELLWVGEYRVGVTIAGGTVWTGWARMSSTLQENFPTTYEVTEVRSQLTN